MRIGRGRGGRGVDAAVGLVALAVGGLAVAAMQPRVFAAFHDDGIYLATAAAIADGDGYRLSNLPGAPAQTKYPPLYSAALSLVARVAPDLPAGVPWYKVSSALTLALVVALAGRFGLSTFRRPVWAVCFAALVGLSPLVFPFADYTLTELPFLAACMGAWALAASARSASGGPDEDRLWPPLGLSTGAAFGLGVTCGVGFLFRSAALPLILAALAGFALVRDPRRGAVFAAGAGLLAIPWLVYKTIAADPGLNPLLLYYTSYEPSALEIAARDPRLALRIFLGNVYYLWGALDLVTYGTYFPGLRIVTYPLLAVGLWRIFRRPVAFLPIFVVLYAGLILLWPWHPSRYAVPLAPLIPLAWFLAIEWLAGRLAPGDPSTESPGHRWSRRAAVAAPALLMLGLGLSWTAAYLPREEETTRAAFFARLPYAWSGFEETARWVSENTPEDAILASAYDPYYYLSTGRRGVRPWFHRPWSYFYPVGAATPDLGTPAEIRPALDDLRARYLVIDPLDGYVEAEAAFELYDALLAGYAPPGYADSATLRFESADGLHRVYELPRPAGADETDPSRRP